MYSFQGIDLRIVKGKKSPDDLRIDLRDGPLWRPIPMAVAFVLVDFFTENERELRRYRGHWVQNGDRYFLSKCIDAVRHGWRHVVEELNRHRGNVA